MVDRYGKMFSIAKYNLPRSDIKTTFRTYISTAIFYSVVVFFSTLATLIVIHSLLPFSFLVRIMIIVFMPFVSAILFFTYLNFYPYQRAMKRKKNIEANLPFVLTHMGAIAESGVPPYVIFKLISEFKEYGEVSVEMGKIVRNIEVFGLNPLAAVREVAKRTPSDSFKQVLLGFITTTESGGDVKIFLKTSGQQALFEWRIRRERFLQQLSAYAEFYTGLLIAAPLFIIALFAVMNMIQPTVAGYDILFLIKLSIYLIVPALNGTFLFFLHGMEVEI